MKRVLFLRLFAIFFFLLIFLPHSPPCYPFSFGCHIVSTSLWTEVCNEYLPQLGLDLELEH